MAVSCYLVLIKKGDDLQFPPWEKISSLQIVKNIIKKMCSIGNYEIYVRGPGNEYHLLEKGDVMGIDIVPSIEVNAN